MPGESNSERDSAPQSASPPKKESRFQHHVEQVVSRLVARRRVSPHRAAARHSDEIGDNEYRWY